MIEWMAVLAIAILTSLGFQLSTVGAQTDNLFFDQAVAWRSNHVSDKIIIVEIDEESLEALGRWPWRRSTHADLIRKLSAAQPSAIGYDVLFTEPSDPQNDANLQAAVKAAQNVILPAFVEQPGKNGRLADIVRPIPPLAQAARATGHVNVRFDQDGIVRQSFGQISDGDQTIPHFTQLLAQIVAPELSRKAIETEGMLIPFHAVGSFQRVSAAKVIAGEIPAAFITDKIILVGASAQGLGDTLPVPGSAGSVMAGVEVQANMLSAELTGDAITSSTATARSVISIIVLLGLLLAFWRSEPTTSLLMTLSVAAVTLIVSAILLTSFHYWFPPSGLLVGILLAYPLWSWRRLTTLNDFVEAETRTLHVSGPNAAEILPRQIGLDGVARAAAALKSVIGDLQNMKTFMSRVIENAPDAIAVTDVAGRVTMTNAKAALLFVGLSDPINFDDALVHIAPHATSGDGDILLPDGRVMMMKSSRFGDEQNGADGLIVRLADVTEQRRAQRQRDEMLEFLSHDMRSPQAAIVALIDHHAEHKGIEFPAQRVRQQALASLKLADDFVQLAKLSHIKPIFEAIDIVSLADEAIDRCFAVAKAKGIKILRPGEIANPYAQADGSMLLRAFVNLIDNAIKYGPTGSAVTVSTHFADQMICVSIADTGPGIPQVRLDALFERFGPSDTSGAISAGLGLAFVKRAVDLHGGKILCRSSALGTQFDISLRAFLDAEITD